MVGDVPCREWGSFSLSVVEQRLNATRATLAGASVTEVASGILAGPVCGGWDRAHLIGGVGRAGGPAMTPCGLS